MLSSQNILLENIKNINHNLSYENLREFEYKNDNITKTKDNVLVIDTGFFTGRSPKDRYLVKNHPSSDNIYWGNINLPIAPNVFDELFISVKSHMSNRDDIFVTDVYACPQNSLHKFNVRFITEYAWHSHFIQNMFNMPPKNTLDDFMADFTIYNACSFKNKDYKKHGLNSDVFIIFNIEKKVAIIGGTYYTGEMKKGIFAMLNYWLPLKNVLSMHCSANIGKNDDVALFFGLSGTGKTTLSTDANRQLIGDDEHGWSDEGIFNFEGGCYAKVINLKKDNEPDIFNAIRDDALLENVIVKNGQVDYSDSTKTQNTRVSYPIEYIKNAKADKCAGHAKNIIFLSCDSFGILPAVSKLTKAQAMYYFLSGYTAKIAGTERGVKEPIAAFSACFGEVFLPLHPMVYANLLGDKIQQHKANVYLVNTGWVGGKYGVGNRISLKRTRQCIDAILSGEILDCEFDILPLFNLLMPKKLKSMDQNILNPKLAWKDKAQYDIASKNLAKMFMNNFERYSDYKDFDILKEEIRLT